MTRNIFFSHMKRCLSGLVQWLEDLNISDWWNLCKSVRRCRCMRWAWWSSGRRSGSHILLTRIVWKWKAKLSNMEVQHIDTNIRTMLYIYTTSDIHTNIFEICIYSPLCGLTYIQIWNSVAGLWLGGEAHKCLAPPGVYTPRKQLLHSLKTNTSHENSL